MKLISVIRTALLATLGGAGLVSGCALPAPTEDTQPPPEELGQVEQAATSTCITIYDGGGNGTVEDALIRKNHPNTNYGASGSLTVSTDPDMRKGLLRFDLSAIPPDAYISSAKVTLTAVLYGGAPTNAYWTTGPWTESTVTWSSFGEAYHPYPLAVFPSVTPGNPQGNKLPPPVTTSIGGEELRSRVQGNVSWSSNVDLLIERDREVPGTTVFASSEAAASLRPRLEVCYEQMEECEYTTYLWWGPKCIDSQCAFDNWIVATYGLECLSYNFQLFCDNNTGETWWTDTCAVYGYCC
jgi:hypothetical protein